MFKMETKLLNALPGAIYWINTENVYQGCNIVQSTYFGLSSPDEIVGKKTADLPFFKGKLEIVAQLDKEHLQIMFLNEQKISEYITVENGQEKIYIVTKSPVTNSLNQVTGLIVMSVDITETQNSKIQHENVSSKITLENILNNLPGHIYWKDLKGHFLGCNLLQAQSAGFSSTQEMIGKTDYEMPWKNQADSYKKHDQQVISTGLPIHVEEQVTLKSGQLVAFLSNKVPYRNENGEIIGVLGISIDISEQKEIEATLKDTTIALENILDNLPGHVYWKDLNGYYLGCNLSQAKNAGFPSPKEVIGKTDFEMPWRKEQAEIYRKNDQMVIKTGRPILAEEEITLERGETHTYLANKVPLRDKDKKIIGILGISLDMTEQKKALSKLQNENVSNKIALENILNHLPAHVYWKDTKGHYLGCNLQQAISCGFNSSDEIIGKTDYDMPWKEQADLYWKNDQQVIKKGITIITEEDATYKSGIIHPFLSSKVPLRDGNNQIIGVLGISVDIHEQKKMQAALKKAEGQTEGMTLVSAAMAHELRTPLAAIIMGMQGIEKYLQSLIAAYQLAHSHKLKIDPIPNRILEKLSTAVSNIQGESKNANLIINMLLTNLSTQQGAEKSTTRLAMSDCIISALGEYAFARHKQEIVNVDLIEDFVFYGNKMLFSHLLFNLIKNSLYFIDKIGKGQIYIFLKKGNDFNELHFKDTGQGIHKEDLPHIFEQFYTKGTHHGTGIGLAFCKAVMESWGGSIACQSNYGEYVEFICYFPQK